MGGMSEMQREQSLRALYSQIEGGHEPRVLEDPWFRRPAWPFTRRLKLRPLPIDLGQHIWLNGPKESGPSRSRLLRLEEALIRTWPRGGSASSSNTIIGSGRRRSRCG